MKPAAVVFRLDEVRKDPALIDPGDRKQIVTQIYPDVEKPIECSEWKPCSPSEKCPVLMMNDTESAVFTEKVKQDRHYHATGTEIYLVLEGRMKIEVEDALYDLAAGDMIVVSPNAWHHVKQDSKFLCRVITVNCKGTSDKYTASRSV
jgi:mannose-6-phosphate isomerase-like protein (cupin superfamily)